MKKSGSKPHSCRSGSIPGYTLDIYFLLKHSEELMYGETLAAEGGKFYFLSTSSSAGGDAGPHEIPGL